MPAEGLKPVVWMSARHPFPTASAILPCPSSPLPVHPGFLLPLLLTMSSSLSTKSLCLPHLPSRPSPYPPPLRPSSFPFTLRPSPPPFPFFLSPTPLPSQIFPGLVRYEEVAAGAILHALRFTVERPSQLHVWPARHSDGKSDDPSLPPMGLRIRLKQVAALVCASASSA